MNSQVGLAEIISYVRTELVRAETIRISQQFEPLFTVKGVELELKVVLKSDTTSKAGFNLQVVSLGGELHENGEQSHTVTLYLDAIALISDPAEKLQEHIKLPFGLLQTDDNLGG